MRILFLNQYFPPDPAPTGLLLRELADTLESEGHTVGFVAARQEYRASQRAAGRLIREFKALAMMLRDGMMQPRADLIISASSPPCLVVVAALLTLRHRARSIHWVMDLYPEIAVALGEVSGGPFVSIIQWIMGWCYRSCAAVVALDEDMKERFEKYGVVPQIIRPWVFEAMLRSFRSLEEKGRMVSPRPERGLNDIPNRWTWMYSGNLGRAHEWETLLKAQAILETRDPEIQLLFQGGGPAWPAAQARARELGLKRCEWRPYVEEASLAESLMRSQCCIVSQLPVTQGLLWPSKLGFLLMLPQPLLWVGPVQGAIAGTLRELPATAIFAPGEEEQIADWLLHLRTSDAVPMENNRFDAFAHRKASMEKWVGLVNSLASAPHGEN